MSLAESIFGARSGSGPAVRPLPHWNDLGGVEWPEPEILNLELPPVLSFDPELLPSSLRPMVVDIANRMQVPVDLPAVVTVAALAGTVGRRALIQPKREDSTWIVVPNLWGGIVAPPGAMKSAVLSCVTRPLKEIEAAWRQEHRLAYDEFQAAKERAELDAQTWRESYRIAQRKGFDLPPKPSFDLVAPAERRLLCGDATFESLHTMLAGNPGGIFQLRDELAGWLAGLERQGREQERSFALESWNGDQSFTVDRIGRGKVHVEHCCLSIFGGIQPARIRSYLADALRGGPLSDGLIQRFGLLVWPDASEKWEYIDKAPDAAAISNAAGVFQSLAALDPTKPVVLKFDPEAQFLFIDWITDLERKIRSRDLSPALQAHFSKYRKLMPALALLFALSDGHLDVVGLTYARQAAAWTEYLESHALRLYSSQCSQGRAASITLGLRLIGGWHHSEGSFTLRDVYRPRWEGLATPAEARAAVAELEDLGWVKKATETPGKVGRTSERYFVNPLLEERHGNS